MSFDDLFDKFVKECGKERLLLYALDFKKLQSDYDRTKFMLETPFISDHICVPPIVENGKSETTCEQSRLSGNEYFKKGKWMEALECFTRSICSSVDDKKAALSYANRSAVLCKLGVKECLEDIERAVRFGYPENRRFKIEERRADFLLSTNQHKLATQSYKEATKWLLQSGLSQNKIRNLKEHYEVRLLKCSGEEETARQVPEAVGTLANHEKDVPALGQPHPVFPSLSSACDVVYSAEKGRHLVATRTLGVGEVVLVEKAYVRCVNLEIAWKHCSHCLCSCYAGSPCSTCAHHIYCSEQCRQAAEHATECQLLRYLVRADLQKCPMLAVKAIIKMPVQEAMKHRREVVRHEYDADRRVVLRGGKYESDDYNTICDLVTNAPARSVNDLFTRAFKAVFLLRIIHKSSYYHLLPPSEHPDADLLIASLLLSHLQAFPSNAHSISFFQINPASLLRSRAEEVGFAVYSTLSLLSHSCHPNVTRSDIRNVSVMRTTAIIREGQEILDNYGILFQLMARPERQETLHSQYYFHCMCVACEADWPLLVFQRPSEPSFVCSHCRLSLTPGKRVCEGCSKQVDKEALSREWLVKQQKFKISNDLLLKFLPGTALPSVLDLIEFMCHHMEPPDLELTRAVETLKQIYDLMANCSLLLQ